MNTSGGARRGGTPLSRSRWRLARRIERRVLAGAEATGSLRRDEGVLVAVSGGPDSTALLLILTSLRASLGLDLTAAYVDHGVRSEEARAADASNVRDLSERLGVACIVERADPPEHSEAGLRAARYAALGRAARSIGASCVALGHTLDDQAETVLMRLVRGTGVEGLGGMRPRSPWPLAGGGPDLARPLLSLRRDEVHAYVEALGEAPRTDDTNADMRYTRNRVRATMLPALAAENPHVLEALARAAESAAEAAGTIAGLVDAAWSDVVEERGGALVLRAEPLLALPAAVRKGVVSRALGCRLGEEQVTAEAIGRVVDLLEGRTGRRATIAGRLVASRTSMGVRMGGGAARDGLPETALRPGTTRVGPWAVELGGEGTAPSEDHVLELDEAIAREGLVVRARRAGDRIRLAGGTRKVQDVLVDVKVPREERDEVPLVCDSTGRVLWVVGHAVDPGARARGARGVWIAVWRV